VSISLSQVVNPTSPLSNSLICPGYTTYNNHILLERNYEEAEARMDELEGTLRGHIGLIEDSLERIEKHVAKAAGAESGWGKGMGARAEELYGQRGRDDKKKEDSSKG
jgi:hypothetical protein